MGRDLLLDESAIKEPGNGNKEKYAGPGVRIGASFIDGIIIFLMTMPLDLFLNLLGFFNIDIQLSGISIPALFISVLIILVYWLYSAWFESSVYMATPGKMISGIMVTGPEGGRISFSCAVRRYLFKGIVPAIISLPGGILFLLAGIAYCIADVGAMFRSDKKQCLHDRWAQTVVVYGKADVAGKSKSGMKKALYAVLIGCILLSIIVMILFFCMFYYLAYVDRGNDAPFVINGYLIGEANLADSTNLTASEKLAAINLTLASAEVSSLGPYNTSDLSRSVGIVKRSNEHSMENKYFTWSYTNLNSGMLDSSLLLVNVPVNYIDPATNTALTMTLFVDLTGNRVLGYERVKNPATTYIRVTEVYCIIPAGSGWYHDLRGNYEQHSSGEIEGRFYRTGFKLECSPEDYRYLVPIIMNADDQKKFQATGSIPEFCYGTGYTTNYDQVIDGSQPVPAQVASDKVAVWNADMTFNPETEVIMGSTAPCLYTLYILNVNPDKDIQIRFELIPR